MLMSGSDIFMVILMAQAALDINALFAGQDNSDNASRKWMVYTGDDATLYRVQVTENIGNVMGFIDLTGANADSTVPLPQYFKMREVHFSDSTGKVKGSYHVGIATADIYKFGGTIKVPRRGKADGLLCYATGTTGESKRFVFAADTGQQSGDAA